MKFDFHNPYPTTRIPVFARNVVSTSHPLAAQAGLRMLWKGGNAVDARHRRGRRDDDLRAGEQRPGQRRLRHPVGRQGTARPQRLGPGAGRWTPEYFRKQVRRRRDDAAEARHRLGHRAGRGAQLGGAVASASASCRSPTCWSRPSRSPSAATCCRSWCSRSGPPPRRAAAGQPGFAQAFLPWGRAPEVGELFQFKAAARGAARRSPQTQGRGLLRRRDRRGASRSSPRRNGGSITAQRPRGLPARVGQADLRATTAATRCTRSRPTARASRR